MPTDIFKSVPYRRASTVRTIPVLICLQGHTHLQLDGMQGITAVVTSLTQASERALRLPCHLHSAVPSTDTTACLRPVLTNRVRLVATKLYISKNKFLCGVTSFRQAHTDVSKDCSVTMSKFFFFDR